MVVCCYKSKIFLMSLGINFNFKLFSVIVFCFLSSFSAPVASNKNPIIVAVKYTEIETETLQRVPWMLCVRARYGYRYKIRTQMKCLFIRVQRDGRKSWQNDGGQRARP